MATASTTSSHAAGTMPGGSAMLAQIQRLIPIYSFGVDDIEILTAKMEMVTTMAENAGVNPDLITSQFILQMKGVSAEIFLRNSKKYMTGDLTGIQRLIKELGGSWGKIRLAQKACR